MRVGKNPFKGTGGSGRAYNTERVTVCTLVYIPNFEGYYRNRFDVLKISLASLIHHTPEEHDLLVFDNGSCPEVIEYLTDLHRRNIIDFLFLSGHNLGYNGALNFIYSVAPGEIIAYGDDDVFYHPGWMSACLEILERFPKVGYVTGCPVKNNYGIHDLSTMSAPVQTVGITKKPFAWNEKWDEIHCQSLGSDWEQWKKKYAAITVPLYEYKDQEALAVSTHFQYVFYKDVKHVFLPFHVGHLMSSELNDPQFNMLMQLDKKLDDSGYLKLSTTGWFTEHLGNTVSVRALQLVEKYKLDLQVDMRRKSNGVMHKIVFRLLSLPLIKNFFHWLYRFSFDVIHWKQMKRL